MSYSDLRDFLDVLRKRGELKVCKRQVDSKIEIARVTDKSTKTGGPAILFENVKGFRTPVVTGLFGTLDRAFLALDATKLDGFRRMQAGMEKPLPCKVVNSGPCKEVIRTGRDVNLLDIPVLWHHEKDSHRFLTNTNVIARDPDTRLRNNSIQRMAVLDKDRLGLWINVPMHLRLIAKKYLKAGKPCPIAVAIGTDPTVLICASCKIPYGMDEMEFAGGVRGEPVELVKCETVDLEVPATSELVIEGEIMPGDEEGYVGKSVYVDEAPFAEITGYFGSKSRSPQVRVKAITHRKDYIYHGLGTAIPPSELQLIICPPMQQDAYARARTVVPAENIKAVNPTLGSCCYTIVISIKKTHPGQAKQVIYAILSHASLKRVIVVDDDIDVFDEMQVDWAVSMRSRAEDYIMTPEMTGQALDPMCTPPNLITKVGIDATLPLEGDKKGRMNVLRDLGPTRYADQDKLNLEDYIGS